MKFSFTQEMKTDNILSNFMNKSKEDEKSEKEDRQVEEQVEQQPEEEKPAIFEDIEREELIALLEKRDQQVEELERQLADAENTVLRKAAELDNYRKRVQRERSQIYNSAKANSLEDFLSISDDLTRTLHASESMDVPQSFLEGVTLLSSKFDEVLTKHGVERIDEEMVPFNVDLHDALMRREPEEESIESDMVLKVVENGYKIDDRVVRHAKVIVSE